MEKVRIKDIDELVSETEVLVNTLEKLKQEIESYDTATKTLEKARKDLGELTTSVGDLSKKQHELNLEFHELVKLKLIKKVDNIRETQEENSKSMEKNFKFLYIGIGAVIILQIIAFII